MPFLIARSAPSSSLRTTLPISSARLRAVIRPPGTSPLITQAIATCGRAKAFPPRAALAAGGASVAAPAAGAMPLREKRRHCDGLERTRRRTRRGRREQIPGHGTVGRQSRSNQSPPICLRQNENIRGRGQRLSAIPPRNRLTRDPETKSNAQKAGISRPFPGLPASLAEPHTGWLATQC